MKCEFFSCYFFIGITIISLSGVWRPRLLSLLAVGIVVGVEEPGRAQFYAVRGPAHVSVVKVVCSVSFSTRAPGNLSKLGSKIENRCRSIKWRWTTGTAI